MRTIRTAIIAGELDKLSIQLHHDWNQGDWSVDEWR